MIGEQAIEQYSEHTEDYGKLTLIYRDAYNGNVFTADYTLTEDDLFWDSLLQKFIKFLEGSGYYVQGKVFLQDGPFVGERWEGPVIRNDE
jgi:hypothetical protein